MITAEIVKPADVDAVWPLISKRIVKCLEKTPSVDMTCGDLWMMCRAGMAFLIVVVDGNSVPSASVWRFEGKKFCCLLVVGETAEKWAALLFEKASEIAKAGGAIGLNGSGRIGLYRRLKKLLPNVRVDRFTYEVSL